MQKTNVADEINHVDNFEKEIPANYKLNLKLISCEIPVKFSEYKVSNPENKMLVSKTKAISNEGILIESPFFYETGILMRIWVEIPNYWMMKSKKVHYKHTSAPKYFQILSRVTKCEEHNGDRFFFLLLCENLALDPVDESILSDYLFSNKDGVS